MKCIAEKKIVAPNINEKVEERTDWVAGPEMMTEDIMITRVANHRLQLHQKILLYTCRNLHN